MTAEAINAWFTPAHYFLYLGVILVIAVCFQMRKWDKESRNNILVLLQRTKGDGDYFLVPIDGGVVNIENKTTGQTQVWGINQLSTIDVPYPGIGFIPRFLQKRIRLVVLSEDTYEPISNRSVDNRLVMTPQFLGNLVNEKVTKAVAMVGQELIDALKGIGKMLNPNHFYIAIGVVIVLCAWNIILVSQLKSMSATLTDLQGTLEALKLGLGL